MTQSFVRSFNEREREKDGALLRLGRKASAATPSNPPSALPKETRRDLLPKVTKITTKMDEENDDFER